MSEIMIVEIMLAVFLLLIGIAVIERVTPSKSKAYRQDLSNMYVAGKIKKIAEDEGLDLNVEFLEFAKITKNKKIDIEALDLTVERELQEKITEGKKEVATEETTTPAE